MEASEVTRIAHKRIRELEAENVRLREQLRHRACGSEEHDPANGKIHGYCIVCLTPWPCEESRLTLLQQKEP